MDFDYLHEIQNLFEQFINDDNISKSEYNRKKEENLHHFSKFLGLQNTKSSKHNDIVLIDTEKEIIIEKYKILDYDHNTFLNYIQFICASLPLNFPELKSELEKLANRSSLEFNKNISEILINKGKKLIIKKENQEKVKIEKWCNIIEKTSHNNILFTMHQEGEYDKNNFVKLYYIINSKNFKLEIHIKDISEELIRFELLFYSENIFEYKIEMNKNLRKISYNDLKKYTNGNIFTKTKRIYMNNSNIKLRVEEDNTKREIINNDEEYKEKSGEWYEITHSNSSYGQKYYENSKKRKYDEDWWKSEEDYGKVKEIKIRSYLDDGYGMKTYEEKGYKMRNGNKIYDYKDSEIENVAKGECITKKLGFNEKGEWNSLVIKNDTDRTTLVENSGKEYLLGELNEWYEKWYESHTEKFCRKWGRNYSQEWEEEWKESNFGEYFEKFCYKKCKILNAYKYWYEMWNEKYSKNKPDQVEKTCFKSNEIEEIGWGDKVENDLEKKWKNYYYHKNNAGNIVYNEYYYFK